MTKEEFENCVIVQHALLANAHQAHITLNGKEYYAQGDSEDEAIENLWEYLTSDLGIL